MLAKRVKCPFNNNEGEDGDDDYDKDSVTV